MEKRQKIISQDKNSSELPSAQISIRSDEVHEILNSVPHWMIRWGSGLILALIVVVFYLSWLIKYPEVVHGTAVLTTAVPPVKIYSKASGYVNKIFVPNDKNVKDGQLIAQIDNPLNKTTIDSLSALLADFDILKYSHLLKFLGEVKPLGQSQTAANVLYSNLLDYSELVNDKFYVGTLESLNQKILYNGRLAWIAKQEIDLYEIELIQAKEKFEADSILYMNKVIPKHTFYRNRSELIAAQQKLFNAKKNYVQFKLAESEFTKQKADVMHDYQIKKIRLETEIQTSINSINNSINLWQENYLIKAPINGRLSFLNDIVEKDFVTPNFPLFAIVPESDNVLAVVKINSQGYGKIEKGQKVRLKLENFPSHEFGQIIGKVKKTSKLAGEEGYIIKVVLPNGLQTTYKKTLQYSPEMKGSAEIVTADLRLIERILYTLRKVFERK